MPPLADYISISVDAVGGPDTDAGKEMQRLLLEREDGSESQVLPAPTKTAALPAATEAPADISPDSILGGDLESMFSRVFETGKPSQ